MQKSLLNFRIKKNVYSTCRHWIDVTNMIKMFYVANPGHVDNLFGKWSYDFMGV